MTAGVPPRRAVEFAALGGGLLAAVLGQVGGASGVIALALACAAASGLGLMLQRAGVQIIGWVLTVLAILGIVISIETTTYLPIIGFVVALVASRIIVRFARHWEDTVRQRRAAAPPDPWQAQDRGIDPTGEMPDNGDSR